MIKKALLIYDEWEYPLKSWREWHYIKAARRTPCSDTTDATITRRRKVTEMKFLPLVSIFRILKVHIYSLYLNSKMFDNKNYLKTICIAIDEELKFLYANV